MGNDVRVILGSKSDAGKANIALAILHQLGVRYNVNVASCHWNAGLDLHEYSVGIIEKIVMFIGGLELAAPGLLEATVRNTGRMDLLVFGVPLDKAARSALENLPPGTFVYTNGFNEIDVTHSLKNSALAVAKLAGVLGRSEILENLKKWYEESKKGKGIERNIELNNNGMILIPE